MHTRLIKMGMTAKATRQGPSDTINLDGGYVMDYRLIVNANTSLSILKP